MMFFVALGREYLENARNQEEEARRLSTLAGYCQPFLNQLARIRSLTGKLRLK
jgi:hypothetical protein